MEDILRVAMVQKTGAQMIRVTQFNGSKRWRSFLVKDPKKIAFYEWLASKNMMFYPTTIKQCQQ